MYEGAWLSAAATGVAAGCYAYAGVALRRRQSGASQGHMAAAFLLVVALFLALAAARQVAAYGHLAWGCSQDADLWLFGMLLVPAALAIVPLVHVVTHIVTGNLRVAYGVAAVFAGLDAIGLAFAYAGGVSGPLVSEWGTDWRLDSVVAKAMLFLVQMLPGLFAGIALFVVGQRAGGAGGRRARLLGVGAAIYYVVFTVDALGLDGWLLLAARLLMGASAFVVLRAYVVPGAPHEAGAASVAQ